MVGVSRGRGPLPDPHVFPQVEILEGKDAGKQGKVVQVIRQRNWVVLEGLNTVSGERMGCSGSPFRVTLREEQPGKEGGRLAAGVVDSPLCCCSLGPSASCGRQALSQSLVFMSPLFRTALPLCWQDRRVPGNHDP